MTEAVRSAGLSGSGVGVDIQSGLLPNGERSVAVHAAHAVDAKHSYLHPFLVVAIDSRIPVEENKLTGCSDWASPSDIITARRGAAPRAPCEIAAAAPPPCAAAALRSVPHQGHAVHNAVARSRWRCVREAMESPTCPI